MRLRKDDIFPAPPVDDAIPPTVLRLEELLAERGESIELRFSLGNVHLREGSVEQAIECFRRALEIEPLHPEVNANLGVALAVQGRNEEALSYFRQSILLKPLQVLPHLHSGRVQLELQQYDAAKISFERASKLSGSSEPLMRLGEVAERRGDEEEALQYYRQAFAVDPALGEARVRLARDCFERGRLCYDRGALEEAFRVWAEGAHEYAPVFAIDQKVTQGMSELEKKYRETDDFNDARNLYAASLRENPDDHSTLYPLFSRFLFSVGLFPECFEVQETLDAEIQRWRSSLESLGEHPYPHFRIGLLHCYSGRLTECEAELRHCQDKLLPKKQASLKLAQILAFISELLELQRQAREGSISRSPDWEWEQNGFTNPFELKQWKLSGLSPSDAKCWKDSGASAAKSKLWAREKIQPETAREWMERGIGEPKTAKKWIRAGAPPDEAVRWQEHFPDNVEQAIQCRSVGFTDPALAAQWLKVVLFPWDAIRWHEAGFTPIQASEWLDQGITDPFAAEERRSRLAAPPNDEQ